MFNVAIENEGHKILGSLEVDSYFFQPSHYEYAFYLYKDEQTFERKWYSDSMKVEFDFDLESNYGTFFIRCFIRDKRDESKRGVNSSKVFFSVQ